MGIFVNRRFNLIYVHASLQAFAFYGGESFAFIYLLKAGIPVPLVLFSIGAMFGSRLLFRMAVLPLAKRTGLRNALVIGIVMEGLTYPILSQITGPGPLLAAYLAMWAISSSIYWTTYHAYVVLIGDGKNRGAQVSATEFAGTVVGIVAPIATGLLLTVFPPIVAFSAAGLAMACSALPLLFLPNIAVAPEAAIPVEARRQGRLLMFADGLRAGAIHFTWYIALFVTLDSSFAAFGGALSLTGLVGAVAGSRLSPLDPLRYFYDSFLANALLAAGRYEESIQVGQRSVRANCTHMPTFRSLAIAQVMGGQQDDARKTIARLMSTQPGYSLEEFRSRYAGRHGQHAALYADALRSAGLPER